jgi:hypothetical protein
MIRATSLVCGLCLAGCSTLPHKPAADTAGAGVERIYSRQHARFSQAVLFKPAEPANPDLLFKLAPLIILQVSDTNLPAQLPDGLINPESQGNPVVNAWADSVQLRGQIHPRVNYVWDHASPPPSAAGVRAQQGVRITLGTNGQPLIWEILADSSGLDLLVVAESLEQAAARQFGPPLPGRRFAIETATNNYPNFVVARAIDDGPVAMGPIVYVEQGTRDIATVICRCMPAQADSLAGSIAYDLRSLPAPTAQWPGTPLEKRIRLPDF